MLNQKELVKEFLESLKEELPCKDNWQKTNRPLESLFLSMDEVIQFLEQLQLFTTELYAHWRKHPEDAQEKIEAFGECIQWLKEEQAKHI